MANSVIEQERMKLPNQDAGRIFVGGMSQGALTSLACLLRYNGTTPLGGVVIESGTMVLNMDNRLTTPEALDI